MTINPPRRWTRVVGYSLMALAGIAAVAWPSPAVKAATGPTTGLLVYVWAILLAVGGVSAAVGSALDRWLGEYAGLWPLVTTFAVYAIAAASSGRGAAIAGAALLGSIAFLLLARWRDVAHLRQEAMRILANHETG